MYLLGFDIGSSSVKVSLVKGDNGATVASAFHPKKEMEIKSPQPGWAEQDPQSWWTNLKLALKDVLATAAVPVSEIKAVGISYQMHGLVLVDEKQEVLRPSIIWCDSRAVEVGNAAFKAIGEEQCLTNLLNSPGNFTASKLKWVRDNQPELFAKVHKFMLPGDYIAMKLTGEITTTASGLSEGMFWDFNKNDLAGFLMEHYGIAKDMVPEIVPTFADQGKLSAKAAKELGLHQNVVVAYRAGDQPNNAFSLNVLNPGEIAATAGTSGVVYGVSEAIKYDPYSRVNTFAHVNHKEGANRLGVLLCINGTGISNSWLKHNVAAGQDYAEMNELASEVAIGSDGLVVLPFGNGAERVLRNKNINAQVQGLSFNTHSQAHLLRAAQEGIVFGFKYGMDVMKEIGVDTGVIRAGNANMFLSPIFRDTLAGVTGATIELYDTDGAAGAAKGAGVGCGYYSSFSEAFSNLTKLKTIEPDAANTAAYADAYGNWLKAVEKSLS